jgi:hypothetical protein
VSAKIDVVAISDTIEKKENRYYYFVRLHAMDENRTQDDPA